MKVANKVILLLNDGDHLSAAISTGLHPNHNSSDLQTLKDSFEFPLQHYGIKDATVSGQIIHFVTPSTAHYEVSVVLLKSYESPVLACALNEVLLQLFGDVSTMPTLIVPVVLPESKLKQEIQYSIMSEKISVHGIKLGPTTDVAQALSSRLRNSSQFVRIHDERLALLVQLVNVMKLPTVVLVGLESQHVSNKSSNEEFEVIYEIGEHLASVSSLSFSKEKVVQNPTKTSRDSKEAWRALYG